MRKKKKSHQLDLTRFFSSEIGTKLAETLYETLHSHKGCTPLESLALKTATAGGAKHLLITSLNSNGDHLVNVLTSDQEILNDTPELLKNSLLNELTSAKTFSTNQCRELLKELGIPDKKNMTITTFRLTDNNNTPIGAVTGFTRDRDSTKGLLNALRFFSINISSELMHLMNKDKLEKKNREFLRTEEELKLKNRMLDNLNKNISRAKQFVDESSRLKSAFLANLSHEIRTPMNVIMGFTELLSADNMSNEQRRNYIDIIQQNGTRLLHIMDSLIDISRFQAKNIGKDRQTFSLNPFMQQLYNTYQPDIEITGKPLKLELTMGAREGEDMVLLDKEATYKTLNHLLDNAVKFTASGHVHFGYEIHNNEICFYVDDTGIGLPKGKENEIFELFRQGDLRLSRQYGGTGLGLAIAKKYVTAMEGQIWCFNKEYPERGTIFKFTLPYKRSENIPSPQTNDEEQTKQLYTPHNDYNS